MAPAEVASSTTIVSTQLRPSSTTATRSRSLSTAPWSSTSRQRTRSTDWASVRTSRVAEGTAATSAETGDDMVLGDCPQPANVSSTNSTGDWRERIGVAGDATIHRDLHVVRT